MFAGVIDLFNILGCFSNFIHMPLCSTMNKMVTIDVLNIGKILSWCSRAFRRRCNFELLEPPPARSAGAVFAHLDEYVAAAQKALDEIRAIGPTDLTLDHHPAAAGAGEGGAGEGGTTGRGRRTVLSVTSVVACAVDKLVLRAHRRGSGEELLLLLRHKVRHEEWEGLDDAARDVEVARSMRGEAERERATVRRLAGCKAWAPLDHELGAAAVARVGPTLSADKALQRL